MAIINISEHHNWPLGEEVSDCLPGTQCQDIFFKGDKDRYCIQVRSTELQEKIKLISSYYVGSDWLEDEKQAIYVAPKLDKVYNTTDYLSMLKVALSQPEALTYAPSFFEIKPDKKFIQLNKEEDKLTPFLVIYYVQILKHLVCNGLKKDYYPVKKDLFGRVKGKVLVSCTLKRNQLKGRTLHTSCAYEEFGINCIENRVLKKALNFGIRYLNTSDYLNQSTISTQGGNNWNQNLSYVSSAFETVEEEADINAIKYFHRNAFYKTYDQALKIARLILQRFGYKINNIQAESLIEVPPFWIDMSRLFELYSLKKLREWFPESEIYYQFPANGVTPDYLLKTKDSKFAFVVDAKYKTVYSREEYQTKEIIDDIRQLSGYARDKKVLHWLGKSETEVIDCLIIHPQKEKEELPYLTVESMNKGLKTIPNYTGFYKIGIQLPTLNK